MDKELKQFVEERLGLENLSYSEKRKKIESKIDELKKVTEELGCYRDEIKELILEESLNPIKEMESKLKNTFPELIVNNEINRNEEWYQIVINTSKHKIDCYLCLYYEENRYEIGINCDCSASKRYNKIKSFLKPIFDKKILKEETETTDKNWYNWNSTTTEKNAYKDFKKLIEAVLELE